MYLLRFYKNMTTKVKKWGNSLAVRLPKDLSDRLNLLAESPVSLKLVGQQLMIKPIKRPKTSLASLVKKINSQNRQEFVNWGKPVGHEVW
jgi:antitoxin MazE